MDFVGLSWSGSSLRDFPLILVLLLPLPYCPHPPHHAIEVVGLHRGA